MGVMTKQGSQSMQGGQKVDSPIDDLTYDVITVLQKKAKAMEAYDKYCSDARGNQEVLQLLEEIKRQDADHIQRLQSCLAQLLGSRGMQQGAGMQQGVGVQQGASQSSMRSQNVGGGGRDGH